MEPPAADPIEGLELERVWRRGARGAGVTVAVIDTAIDAAAPALAGGVIERRDFTGADPETAGDTRSHGTAIASVIRAIAPECRIVGLNIFPRDAWPFFYNDRVRRAAVRAVDHCMDREVGIRACNMSFAIPRRRLWRCRPERRCSLCRRVNAARAEGLLPVAAAGNTGPGPDTIECPGITEGAFTVGAMFSAAERRTFDETPAGDRAARYGTSFSAAYVSGAAALLFSAAPYASVEEVVAAIKHGGMALADGTPSFRNFEAALTHLIGPGRGQFDAAFERLYWVAGNRDAQRPDNAYVVEALDLALAYLERGLLRAGRREEAAALAEKLEEIVIPDRLPEHHARLRALRGGDGPKPE